MSPVQYKKYQQLICSLSWFIEEIGDLDECVGNELFQRMADSAYQVLEKYDAERIKALARSKLEMVRP